MVVHVQDSLPHEVLLGEIECIGSAERIKGGMVLGGHGFVQNHL